MAVITSGDGIICNFGQLFLGLGAPYPKDSCKIRCLLAFGGKYMLRPY